MNCTIPATKTGISAKHESISMMGATLGTQLKACNRFPIRKANIPTPPSCHLRISLFGNLLLREHPLSANLPSNWDNLLPVLWARNLREGMMSKSSSMFKVSSSGKCLLSLFRLDVRTGNYSVAGVESIEIRIRKIHSSPVLLAKLTLLILASISPSSLIINSSSVNSKRYYNNTKDFSTI